MVVRLVRRAVFVTVLRARRGREAFGCWQREASRGGGRGRGDGLAGVEREELASRALPEVSLSGHRPSS